MPNKYDIRFIVDIEQPRYLDSTVSFTARAIYLVDPEPAAHNPNDAGVRNPLSGRWDDLAHLADFVITAQRSTDLSDTDWYAYQVSYERPYRVELDDAERMVKFLRKVNAKLAKLDDKFGRPDSLAAYCARVADAIGCTSKQPWGFYHKDLLPNGTHYHFTDNDGLRYRLAKSDA